MIIREYMKGAQDNALTHELSLKCACLKKFKAEEVKAAAKRICLYPYLVSF